jgi:hypothetical protein
MNWCSYFPSMHGVRFSFGFGSDGYFVFTNPGMTSFRYFIYLNIYLQDISITICDKWSRRMAGVVLPSFVIEYAT